MFVRRGVVGVLIAALGSSCFATGYQRGYSTENPSALPGGPTTWENGGHSPVEVSLTRPVTSYSAKLRDSAGYGVHFVWTMTGERCGTPTVPWTQEGQTVTWSHSGDPPDNCSHASTDHAVTVTLTATVTDGPNRGRKVVCVVHGTETGAASSCE